MKKFIPLALIATAVLVGCGSGEDDGQLATQAPPTKEGAVGSKPNLNKQMPNNSPTGTGGPAGSNVQKPAEKPAGM